MLSEETKKKVTTRLKRIEGQTGALIRMVEEEQECVNVLLQISAVHGALSKVGQIILGEHIETCVADAFEHGDEAKRQSTVAELMDVFARYGRI